jgi:restriction system protein
MWRRLFIKMPVPEFNEIKAPALELFADGKPHKISEVYKALALHFKLTEQDLSEVLPSGRQSRWRNRANWACYDLYRAGLLDRPKRGLYIITELGKKVAERRLAKIDRDYLMQFSSPNGSPRRRALPILNARHRPNNRLQ